MAVGVNPAELGIKQMIQSGFVFLLKGLKEGKIRLRNGVKSFRRSKGSKEKHCACDAQYPRADSRKKGNSSHDSLFKIISQSDCAAPA
jgi:hypothetical protein